MRLRQERIRWLPKRAGRTSPINEIHGLSDGAKLVYSYLASVTLRFGSSHSKVTTIARVTHLSENRARAAIRELERRLPVALTAEHLARPRRTRVLGQTHQS